MWASQMNPDLNAAEIELTQSLSKSSLPIHIIAFENLIPVGSAALKLQELDDVYPECQYWLGSVFVDKHFRGGKIASALTMHVVELANSMSLPHLYLQTSKLNGGLYAQLGWKPLEKFSYKGEKTLLMLKSLT